MSGWEPFLNAIGKYSWRSMFGVFAATGTLIFFSDRLGIADWERPLHGWFIVAFILSGAVLLTYLGSAIYPWFAEHAKNLGVILGGKRYLHHLSADEKAHCQWFIDSNGVSLHHNEANGAIGSLVERGILFAPGQPWGNGLRDFRIRPWALKYLRKRPGLLQ